MECHGVAWGRYKHSDGGVNAESEPLCENSEIVFTPWVKAALCNPDAVASGLNATVLANQTQAHSSRITGYCTRCRDSATGFATAMVLAVVTCIPTIQTDLQRAYRKYDLNCQKFLAVFVGGIFSCLNTLASFAGFLDNCRRSLPEKPFLSHTSVSDVRAKWDLGIGLTLLMFATFFKLIDAAIHCAIKTPDVCHMDREARISHGRKVGTAPVEPLEPADVEMS